MRSKRKQGRVREAAGSTVGNLEAGALQIEQWRKGNCLVCRLSPEWAAGHGGNVGCLVGEDIVRDCEIKGFPREAVWRYVLGRGIEDGLKMGDTWPKMCVYFERGVD